MKFCRQSVFLQKIFDKMFVTKLCQQNTFRPKCHSMNDAGFLIAYQFVSFVALSSLKQHLTKWKAGI